MKKKTARKKSAKRSGRTQGCRYTEEQKGHVLGLVSNGMGFAQAAATIGASAESVRPGPWCPRTLPMALV